MKEPKLTIELVPSTCWYANVRSNVTRYQWDVLRREVYKEYNYCCAICGGKGSKHPVECHEVWEYDEEKHIQKLVKMIAVCPDCHNVKHIGRASIIGKEEDAILQLCKVNKWNRSEARKYVDKQYNVWQQRSLFEWKLDISLLKNKYNVDLGKLGEKSSIDKDKFLEHLSKY